MCILLLCLYYIYSSVVISRVGKMTFSWYLVKYTAFQYPNHIKTNLAHNVEQHLTFWGFYSKFVHHPTTYNLNQISQGNLPPKWELAGGISWLHRGSGCEQKRLCWPDHSMQSVFNVEVFYVLMYSEEIMPWFLVHYCILKLNSHLAITIHIPMES